VGSYRNELIMPAASATAAESPSLAEEDPELRWFTRKRRGFRRQDVSGHRLI
jgi:hypothetical protein